MYMGQEICTHADDKIANLNALSAYLELAYPQGNGGAQLLIKISKLESYTCFGFSAAN